MQCSARDAYIGREKRRLNIAEAQVRHRSGYDLRMRGACLALLFSSASLVAACGSRTGLLSSDDGLLAAIPPDLNNPKTLACKDGEFDLKPSSLEVIFVIDRSGSMAAGLTGDNSGKSKWVILRDALTPMVQSLATKMTVGAKFYPEAHDGRFRDPSVACRVDLSVSDEPAMNTNFLGTFSTTQPAGGTPTADALRATVDYLSKHEDRSVSRFLILATDGAPNCNGDDSLDSRTCVCTTTDPEGCRTGSSNPYNCLDDSRTVKVIKDALATHFVPTFVIGIGETERPEFLDVLDRMAVAGGRGRDAAPHYYSARSRSDLGDALGAIERNLSACTYVTPSRPETPDAITVRVGGKVLLRDTTHQSGWDWLDRDFGKIGFYGSSCDGVAQGGGATVKVDCTLATNTTTTK